MKAHAYQIMYCKNAKQPILNAACKEDPAKLGVTYGAINLDVWDECKQSNVKFATLPNFVQGDVCDMHMFKDGHFGTVVLGEFLEHCVVGAARRALNEVRRVLADDGTVALTFPLDPRPPEAQHAKIHLKIYVKGETGHDMTVWHQTVWLDPMLASLFEDTGFKEIHREPLDYAFVGKLMQPNGWAVVLAKAKE